MNEDKKKLTTELTDEFKKWLEAPETKGAIEAIQKAADAETGTFEVVITTENVDRYGEVIKLDGWDFTHYRNNPVVLWGHDHHTPPIGMATSVEITDGKVIAKGKFAPHEFAQDIRKLYDMGMMRATSVGFIAKEQEGNLITKAELLEFSFVSVPANPFALSLMVKEGVSVNEMVTKGFVLVQKEEEPKDEEKTEADPVVTTTADDVTEVEINKTAVSIAKQSIKDALIALEALDTEEEPEGDEAPDADEDDEEAKRYKDFSEKRRVVQEAVTIFGEVLAEARRAVEAHK